MPGITSKLVIALAIHISNGMKMRVNSWAGILVQFTIYHRLVIGRDAKPTIYCKLYENTDPGC